MVTLGRPPHRARGGHDLQIRRNRRIVQGCPLRSVRWVDIPQLSTGDRCCPAAWQQYWQQSRRNGLDPRPSAFQTRRIPPVTKQSVSVRGCCAPLTFAVGCCYRCQRRLENGCPHLAGHGPCRVQARAWPWLFQRRPGGVVLPWPAAGQFHFEREAQEGADQDDDAKDAHTGEGGLGGDGADDVPGY